MFLCLDYRRCLLLCEIALSMVIWPGAVGLRHHLSSVIKTMGACGTGEDGERMASRRVFFPRSPIMWHISEEHERAGEDFGGSD